jgi:hypothetical protein
VLRFLGPEWIAAFNEAALLVDLAAPPADAGLSVQDGGCATAIIAGDGSGTSVTVTVGGGRLAITGGATPEAGVTVRVGWNDARCLLAGAWVPTAALAAGRAQIRGDLGVLRACGLALETLQPHLAGVWAETEDRAPAPDTSGGPGVKS